MPLLTELTPDWLKNRFLVGVDLTLDDGTAYPDTIFEQSIASAIAYIEHEIGLCLDPFSIADEGHDAYGPNRTGWWPFRLDHRPVIEVTGLRVKYGAFPHAALPVSWVQLPSEIHAQIHLIPSADSIDSAYKFSRGVPMITADVIQPERYIPGYFRFDYRAGFETRSVAIEVLEGQTEASVALDPYIRLRYTSSIDAQPLAGITATVASRGTDAISIALSAAAPEDATYTVTLSTLPADIKQAIGYKASLLPLDVAGDLIAGAGIATMHIGVDGLSQSLGTTASATNAGYGARVLQFERELKAMLPALRAKYRMMNIGVI